MLARTAHPVRATLWRLALLSLVVALAACSDNTTSSGSSCPQGTHQNPITGACQTTGRTGPDPGGRDGGLSDASTQPDAAGPHDTGTSPTSDAGTGPSDAASDAGTSGADTSTTACQGIERRCHNGNVETCHNGQFQVTAQCTSHEICSRGNCIPNGTSCQPGESQCVSATAYKVCASDGQSFNTPVSCPQGQQCQGGQCVDTSGCAGLLNEKSNLGCQYVSMRLNQANGLRTLPHTVVVSNPGTQAATVHVTSPGITSLNIPDQTIQPQQSAIINFPTSPMISQPGLSDKIYFLTTSRPVIATQFAPLNNPGVGSETSDASLLLPTNALGNEYVVLDWPGPPGLGSFQPAGTYIDVVATKDNTTIQVSGPRALSAGSAGSMAANSSQTFTIPKDQVLHLAENGGMASTNTDVSGTVITSNQPVAVFTGATIVDIPDHPVASNPPAGCAAKGATCTHNADCCTGICGYDNQSSSSSGNATCLDTLMAGDHLEQQLFPTDTWGTSYVATPFYKRGVNDFVIYKVTAAHDNTTITLDPPVDGNSTLTLNRGEVKMLYTPDAFEMDASNAIMVAQFMIGGSISTSGNGDPAFLLPPAVEQFRDSYVFLVPDQYALNFVTLIAPTGMDVTLDGNTIPASSFTPVGGQSNWSYKLIDSLSGGVHTANASQPFGVVVHGMDSYISYAFAGGIILPN